MSPHRTRGRLLVALAASFILVAGCTGNGGDGSSSHDSLRPRPIESSGTSSPATGLKGYYQQKLDWQSCRSDYECARLRVPLDYAKPKGKSIEIAVLKASAKDKGSRLGSIVFDPGGPGVSGADYVANSPNLFGTAVLKHYDIVGLDPRGVGASSPVTCVSDGQLNQTIVGDPDPDTPAEVRHSDALARRFGRGCIRQSGDLARHISTVEVAKDLDVLRAALGENKLTYFGASYGTAIGSTYADLFPKNVGRMVLDGALDPRSSTLEIQLGQAKGFETALRAYVGACVSRGSCFLGSTVDQGTHRIRQFLDQVDRKPLSAGSGRELTEGNAWYGISAPLYSRASWGVLDAGLQKAFDGDGSLLMMVADAYLHRHPDGTYDDNTFQALYAINCLDHDDAIPSSHLARYDREFDKASPTFGRGSLAGAAACQDWPVHTGMKGKRVHATGAAPILVIGTTRDPVTPYKWAQSLAKQLDNAVLVTRDGDGHTGYRQGSPCVDTAVESYLVSGIVPKHDLRCS